MRARATELRLCSSSGKSVGDIHTISVVRPSVRSLRMLMGMAGPSNADREKEGAVGRDARSKRNTRTPLALSLVRLCHAARLFMAPRDDENRFFVAGVAWIHILCWAASRA